MISYISAAGLFYSIWIVIFDTINKYYLLYLIKFYNELQIQ